MSSAEKIETKEMNALSHLLRQNSIQGLQNCLSCIIIVREIPMGITLLGRAVTSMSKRPMGIKDVYNDNVDILLRIAHVLALATAVASTTGFMENFAIYDKTLPNGICACAAIFVFKYASTIADKK